MKLRLWHRLFALTALATLAALLTMLMLQQQGFRSGLLAYVNAVEHQRAQKLLPVFAGEYRAAGGWERLRGNPMLFRRLMDQGLEGESRPPPPGPGERPGRGAFAPPGPPGPPGLRPRDRPEPPPGEEPPRRRYALQDAAGQTVIGPPEPWPDAEVLPVVVDGQTVGRLLVRPLPTLEAEWDLEFARSQWSLGVAAAVLALLLASLGSIVFARRLVRPLNWMAQQAKRIAGGDYQARVAITRDDEIGELAHDFDAMAAALQQNREARQRWTAEISHELRTPIAVMRAELDALQDGIRPFDAQALRSLSGEAERLSRLVEDLYQLSLADAGALHYRFEDCDLAALVRESLAAHSASFERAGLQLSLALPDTAPVRADQSRVRQLLANLWANSCRYTDRGGQVRLALVAVASGWQLTLEDSAPGVPPEALGRLFDPLFRVESSRNRAHGGAGLGLAIARRIVEAHAARIRAEASPLGGLRIVIDWPAGGPG
ncbi:MAG: ATP-binding protein [Lysobacterales bacterium]